MEIWNVLKDGFQWIFFFLNSTRQICVYLLSGVNNIRHINAFDLKAKCQKSTGLEFRLPNCSKFDGFRFWIDKSSRIKIQESCAENRELETFGILNIVNVIFSHTPPNKQLNGFHSNLKTIVCNVLICFYSIFVDMLFRKGTLLIAFLFERHVINNYSLTQWKDSRSFLTRVQWKAICFVPRNLQ